MYLGEGMEGGSVKGVRNASPHQRMCARRGGLSEQIEAERSNCGCLHLESLPF